ncbi:MAG: tandem-95 repeat protein [Candidatus Binatia bacterium]
MMLWNRLHQRILLMGLIILAASLMMHQSDAPAAQLRLTWSDNSDNEEGFEVQRWTPNAGFVAIAIVGGNVSAFTDSAVLPGSPYCYRVRAFSADAISDYSNLGCATTPTTVSVSRFGSGAGSVLSSPPGIDCGNDCIEPYASGTVITLVPLPAAGSVFAGWNGAGCAGTGVCMFNIETDLSVTAVFDSINPASTPPPSEPPPPPTPPISPLILTGLSADLISPQVIGASVTFTAAAAGGGSPLQFKWRVFDGLVWRVEKDWDPSDTFVFTPASPASYVIGLWARSAGDNNDGPENNAAVLTRTFTITPASCPTGQYLAEFHDNMSLSGIPIFTSCDYPLNYDWANGGPGYGIGGDNFSVRWTGRFPFSTGLYNFTARADDGIRTWIDGTLIIDAWVDQGATTYQTTPDVSEGEHVVRIEYYHNGGNALTQVVWRRLVTSSDDYYITFEDSRLTIDAPGVLGNDNEINGNPLAATLLSTTSNGVLGLNPDGSFSYTPNPNFSGTDSFTYRADNGSANSNLATVTITVSQVNDIPVASNDSYAVLANASWAIDAPGVLANDNDLGGDALTAVLIDTTTNGALTLNPDGSFIYTPNSGFIGTDTFTYVANDGTNDSNIAMVAISVTVLNEIPLAQNDGYETTQGSVLTVAAPGVLGNDADPDSNPLAAILVTAPLFGTLTLNPDGSFDYIPVVNFTGTDSFSYKATDGGADSNVAMVTIAVNPGTGP